MNQEKENHAQVYKILPREISYIAGETGISINVLSPFCGVVDAKYQESLSEGCLKLSQSNEFKSIAKLLLKPDLKLLFHSGGGVTTEEKFFVLLSEKEKEVIAQFQNKYGELLLIFFEDWMSFLEWWSGIYGTEGNGAYQQLFKEREELEILVSTFHCIDTYRRSYMNSMLNYVAQPQVEIPLNEFVNQLKKSVSSGDTRWLLPNLFELTPGLKNVQLALKPEHLNRVQDIGLLKNGEDSTFIMQEMGIAIGTEFMSTWMGGMGWQAMALINGKEKSLAQLFMTSTAFTNHLFSIEKDSQGKYYFHHQAINRVELIKALIQWKKILCDVLSGTWELELANTKQMLAESIMEKQEMAAEGARFCTKCGKQLRHGAKFCTSCGTAVK